MIPMKCDAKIYDSLRNAKGMTSMPPGALSMKPRNRREMKKGDREEKKICQTTGK